jgi:hypothetical protein
VSRIVDRTFAISVFPTPASPSSRSGLRRRSVRNRVVARLRSAMYFSPRRATSSSSTESKVRPACVVARASLVVLKKLFSGSQAVRPSAYFSNGSIAEKGDCSPQVGVSGFRFQVSGTGVGRLPQGQMNVARVPLCPAMVRRTIDVPRARSATRPQRPRAGFRRGKSAGRGAVMRGGSPLRLSAPWERASPRYIALSGRAHSPSFTRTTNFRVTWSLFRDRKQAIGSDGEQQAAPLRAAERSSSLCGRATFQRVRLRR